MKVISIIIQERTEGDHHGINISCYNETPKYMCNKPEKGFCGVTKKEHQISVAIEKQIKSYIVAGGGTITKRNKNQ